jgi:diacylglycerol kinase family enzyme
VSKLAVIYNPQKITLARVKKLFQNSKLQPEFFATDKATLGAKATKEALAYGAKKIMVAGGDGTLRQVVQQLAGKDVAIGIIPIGTGNVLARNLKLPLTLEGSTKRALEGSPYAIDLGVAKVIRADGRLEEYLFTGIAGVGMDARLMQNTQDDL